MKSNRKIALVTGGAKRIGQAICRLLHESGIDLMIHYRYSVDEAKKLEISDAVIKSPFSPNFLKVPV